MDLFGAYTRPCYFRKGGPFLRRGFVFELSRARDGWRKRPRGAELAIAVFLRLVSLSVGGIGSWLSFLALSDAKTGSRAASAQPLNRSL